MTDQTEFDVIVVGGGGSGLAAAVSACEHGASVLLLEKCPTLGGTTGIAVGSFTANGTAMQRRNNIDDNPDNHEADAARFGPPEHQARNNTELRHFFLSHSAETLEWLMGMGLRFHGPTPEPPNRVPRMHNVVPNAKAYIAALQSRLMALGGHIVCHALVTELIRANGRIEGVQATVADQEYRFRARHGVILAAGDYANSPELIAEYKGSDFSHIEGINPYATGDGHRLARNIGAELVNMDITYGPEIRFVPPSRKAFVQLLPTYGPVARLMGMLLPFVPAVVLQALIKRLLVTWQHPEDALYDHGAILINNRGERFCNERSYPEREIAIARQPGGICYSLLDERVARLFSEWPNFISTAPKIAYAYVNDYLKLRPDVACRANSLGEISRLRGIPPTSLTETVTCYNHYVSGDSPDEHGRNGDEHELSGDSWTLLGPARAYFTTTEGGVRINQSFEAIDSDGNIIEGLYAVGQNGLSGMVLWGHGLHIGWAMTSGRLAGKHVAGVNNQS